MPGWLIIPVSLFTFLSSRLPRPRSELKWATCSRGSRTTSVAAIAELARMRARGSRTFLVAPIPVPGLPPMHPHFEPLWSAAEDLGMMALVHVGAGCNAYDPAWANYSDGMVLRQLGATQAHQAAMLMMNGMVFGGVVASA